MRVLIIGAGLGGLTLALALHRRGLRPVILERAATLEAAGAGVQLGPNATRLLIDLGLEAPLRAAAFAPEAVQVHGGASGRVLLRVGLGKPAQTRWGAPYLQLHRADLQALLLEAVTTRDAGELRLGAGVAAVQPQAAVLESGERIEAEVIVGADGVRSLVRSSLGGPDPLRLRNETAWRALIPISRVPAVARVWTFASKHLVAYPVSGGRALNIVAVTPGRPAGESWVEPGDPAVLRAAFAGANAYVRGKLEAVSETTRWAVADLSPVERWTDGGRVLMGDAAHAMAPYLAQGAAMAIEDAEALARHLAGSGDVARRLAAYEAERKPRTARVQAASRRNGAIFHLPPRVSDLAFAIARMRGAAPALDWLYGYRPPSGQ